MKRCKHCQSELPQTAGRGRKRVYCGDACRKAAQRARHIASKPEISRRARTTRKTPETPPAEAPGRRSAPEFRDGRYGSIPEFRDNLSRSAPQAHWLWLDARQGKGTPDWPAALAAGVALFEQKPRWGGQSPQVVKAHPDVAGNGLKPVAAELGLVVVGDATITPGTYRLGLKGG